MPALKFRPWITILPIARSNQRPRKAPSGSEPARQASGLTAARTPTDDIDPATASSRGTDDEARLPDIAEEPGEAVAGRRGLRSAMPRSNTRCASPRPRPASTACSMRPTTCSMSARPRMSASGWPPMPGPTRPQPARILRMIAATVAVEIISTATETEALLLEANLIKQLRPRFNVQLRDDKSFPYILITGDHWAPQILKHRGAQSRPGRYFGPFASAGAVNRTITALQRAFLMRSCTDAFFESRTRPCLLYQIRRCSGPCTGEIDFPGYTELVREATDFLSGRSRLVKQELAGEMEKASAELEFETAALYRDRLAALVGDPVAAGHQSAHGRGSRRVRHPSGGRLFLRRGVLLPHRTELGQPRLFSARGKILHARRRCWPRSSRSSTTTSRRRNSSCCRTRSRKPNCWPMRCRSRPASRSKSRRRERGEKKELIAHALTNAREALGRKLADTATQSRLLAGPGHHARPAAPAEADRGLRQQPHPGHQRGRRHDRGRPGRLHQKPVPQVQHQVRRPDAGRRLRDDARGAAAALQAAVDAAGRRRCRQSQGRTTIRFRNGPISSSSTAAAASSTPPGRSSTGSG